MLVVLVSALFLVIAEDPTANPSTNSEPSIKINDGQVPYPKNETLWQPIEKPDYKPKESCSMLRGMPCCPRCTSPSCEGCGAPASPTSSTPAQSESAEGKNSNSQTLAPST
eukprot:c338_g1_i1.p1 GENE.c338_g1_i1~~c338_g1_i1.p1  ORF type:complete len:111 (+),score=18.09 c338_g1_i1:38-370(+)